MSHHTVENTTGHTPSQLAGQHTLDIGETLPTPDAQPEGATPALEEFLEAPVIVERPLPERSQLPKVEWELIDRERAETYLGFNEGNRKARKDAVDTYVRDLRSGQWEITGDAIRFDTSGRLIDGQHRLMAIAKSGIPAWQLVIRDLDAKVQRVLDTQVRRSAADALRFVGIERNASLIAAIARQALTYTQFMDNELSPVYVRREAPSNSEVEAYVAAHPEIHEAAVMANVLNKVASNGHVAWGLAWMKFMAVEPVDAAEFFTSMANMSTKGKGDPRHTLLTFIPASKGRGRLAVGEMLCAISVAWNYYRAGQKLHILRVKINGEYRPIPVAD